MLPVHLKHHGAVGQKTHVSSSPILQSPHTDPWHSRAGDWSAGGLGLAAVPGETEQGRTLKNALILRERERALQPAVCRAVVGAWEAARAALWGNGLKVPKPKSVGEHAWGREGAQGAAGGGENEKQRLEVFKHANTQTLLTISTDGNIDGCIKSKYIFN